ncbi:MAG: type II toxin-antitoxin system HicB family antitoxin [Proteobacteria bacterium]|nr:type II toxin-antitoxin system HicB family antitoxin [Pseudomonadota bacterium]
MEANNESISEPIACRKYSGKFMVRISLKVHRNLAIRAAESGISINRVVSCSTLSQ